jgi:uncharacterized membrane protein YeaQ/YmgE (transglycosylase-associated protein family)
MLKWLEEEGGMNRA